MIQPHYPDTCKSRPPVEIERMLRIYFLQQWFNLPPQRANSPGTPTCPIRRSDETTVCKLRHLLERHGLGKRIFAEVNGYLDRHGLKIGTGTIVDATILHAPSSTKNRTGKRAPEMHQVRKGNQWYFGIHAISQLCVMRTPA